MIVVMQCAGKKMTEAGNLRTPEGEKVLFVADPEAAPRAACRYARPDEDSGWGVPWRTILKRYNEAPEGNPLGLLNASELYRNDVYRRLARHVGVARLFILSAGWGLIPATFLTPNYDITFKPPKRDEYKRRKADDTYFDFKLLPADTRDEVIFIGSKEYVPLFASLTSHLTARRTVFFRTNSPPEATGCEVVKFETRRVTNWQYACADAFIAGQLPV